MDFQGRTRISLTFPGNHTGLRVPQRLNILKVTGLASHDYMRIMGDFFIMGGMTLTAIVRYLSVMLKRRCPGVADQTVYIRMGDR